MFKRKYLDTSKIMLVAVVVGLSIVGSAQYAYAAAQGSATDAAVTASSTPSATATAKPTEMTEAQKKELQSRMQKRIADQKTKLTTVQQTKLANGCTTAQGKLKTTGERMDVVRAKRTEIYGNITTKLSSLVTKLKAQSVDTATLESQIKELNTKIDTYNTDLATYKQTVADLVAMDCASDPTAFQASLEAARAALTKVRTDAAAISDYIKNTIKPTLTQIRQKLTTDSTQSSEGSAN